MSARSERSAGFEVEEGAETAARDADHEHDTDEHDDQHLLRVHCTISTLLSVALVRYMTTPT